MTISYNNGVPAGPNNPSVDQTQMLLNTKALNAIWTVDHSGFNSAGTDPGGYHEIIHQVQQGTWLPAPRTGAPAKTAGFNELVALKYTPDTNGGTVDTQLFNITGNGGVSQLTGNISASEGFVWSGGLLFQWGGGLFLSGSNHQTGTILFRDAGGGPFNRPGCIPFPSQCFIVNATLTGPNTIVTNGTITITSISNTQFSWNFSREFTSSSSTYTGFYWFAVGQ